MPESSKRTQIIHRTLPGMQPLDYYAYIPERPQENRVLVTMHGISRNAKEHVQGFIPQAEQFGVTIIAPLFPKSNFPRYQQLGNSVQQGRADLAFDQILQDAAKWLQLSCFPLTIFGFSGGGQFSHRYAMFYPHNISRMVLAAPGWFTFPDPDQHYPYGLRSTTDWPKLNFDAEPFLQIPTLVLIGDEDDLRDEDLNKERRIDALQGFNRIERGERWVNAMRAMGRAFAVPTDFRFEKVPKANHAFESYMGHAPFNEQVFNFLFGPAS